MLRNTWRALETDGKGMYYAGAFFLSRYCLSFAERAWKTSSFLRRLMSQQKPVMQILLHQPGLTCRAWISGAWAAPRFTQYSWEREIIVLMTLVSSHKAGWRRNAAQHVGRSSKGNQLMFSSAMEAQGLSVGTDLQVSTSSLPCQQMPRRWER